MAVDGRWVKVVCRQDERKAEVEEQSIETPKKVEWERNVLSSGQLSS